MIVRCFTMVQVKIDDMRKGAVLLTPDSDLLDLTFGLQVIAVKENLSIKVALRSVRSRSKQ